MKQYVIGFMFCKHRVALVQKNRPVWQAGFWNGIGGKVEPGEYINSAMQREFLEEAGVNTPIDSWKLFATLADTAGESKCYVYKCRVITPPNIKTMTDEPVQWWDVNSLPKVISNLKWLIPYALNADDARFVLDYVYDHNKKGDF